MAIDQAHEQANDVIKGNGGAVGMTENPSALRRWMMSWPEVSHLVAQYETVSQAKDTTKVAGTMSWLSTPKIVHGQSEHAHQGDWRPAWATIFTRRKQGPPHTGHEGIAYPRFTPTMRGTESASQNLSMV